MKIAFLCKSLEPGRDGVGDYTRRLAGELIRHGDDCIVFAINDSFVAAVLVETQEIEGSIVSAFRLPESMSWKEKASFVQKKIEGFNPDWISLQFVPFAYHPKGIVKEFNEHFGPILRSRRFHLMFHELWILWQFPLALRKRILGQFQKIHVRKYASALRPQAVATQLPLYQSELTRIGLAAEIHPLHGNIPVIPKAEAKQWMRKKCESLDLNNTKVAGFFGNLLPTLDIEKLGSKLSRLQIDSQNLLIVLAGKTDGETGRLFDLIQKTLGHLGSFTRIGELNEREASLYFSALDYGLTSYPIELMDKSGSVAAMREHGVPLIACGTLNKRIPSDNAEQNEPRSTGIPWTVKQSAELLRKQLNNASQ